MAASVGQFIGVPKRGVPRRGVRHLSIPLYRVSVISGVEEVSWVVYAVSSVSWRADEINAASTHR